MLRVRTLEAIDARELWLAADAEQRCQRPQRSIDQLVIRIGQGPRIAGAADERPQQHAIVRRAMRPLR